MIDKSCICRSRINHGQCLYSTRKLGSDAAQFDAVVAETLDTLTEALEELPDFIPDVPEIFDVSS